MCGAGAVSLFARDSMRRSSGEADVDVEACMYVLLCTLIIKDETDRHTLQRP